MVQETFIFNYSKGMRDKSIVAQRRHTEAMAAKNEELQQTAAQLESLQSQISELRPAATLFWKQTRSVPEIGEVCKCSQTHNSTRLLIHQPQ